jgi:hypothetical protein
VSSTALATLLSIAKRGCKSAPLAEKAAGVYVTDKEHRGIQLRADSRVRGGDAHGELDSALHTSGLRSSIVAAYNELPQAVRELLELNQAKCASKGFGPSTSTVAVCIVMGTSACIGLAYSLPAA